MSEPADEEGAECARISNFASGYAVVSEDLSLLAFGAKSLLRCIDFKKGLMK